MVSDSNGEVYGTGVLNLAVIAASVFMLLSVVWQPASGGPAPLQAPTAQAQQVAVAHHAPAVSG